MNEITILLIIFSLLFLIEIKSINNLANYIGIVLSIAILISLYFPSLSYISFILILIQISALTILFGLIIMLFPNNHTLPISIFSSIKGNNQGIIISNKDKSIFILLFLLFILFNLDFSFSPFSFFPNLEYLNINYIYIITGDVNDLLYKIGQAFYTDPHFISKFLLLTFLLFFAIVALFYLVLPSNTLTIKTKDTVIKE